MAEIPAPVRLAAVTEHPAVPEPATPPNAGLLRRLGAMAYDSLVVAALLMLAGFAALALTGGEAVAAGRLWFRFLLVLVIVGFFCGFWMRGGQTIGMRAWRLKLVRDGAPGGTISLPRALGRLAAACLAALPAGLGYIWILIDRRDLAWHDRLSGTRVVHLPREPRQR